MTALLLEAPVAKRAPLPVRTTAPGRKRVTSGVRSCVDVGRRHLALVPRAAAMTPGRLYWTRRGVAAMLLLVALVTSAAVATLVSAFLAVSDAPLAAPAAPATVVALAAPGR